MLLRLHVKGFKNLRDVEVRFGPLTCFVGPNGVGKSNLFDAIQFLRHLADEEIQRAAERVRGPVSGSYSPLELFWDKDPRGRIELEADMIVPLEALDDFGQTVNPAITLLRYAVRFAFSSQPRPRLVLDREDLSPLKLGDARVHLAFPHSIGFRRTVAVGRRAGAFISTDLREGPSTPAISLHGDGGSRGRPVPAEPSPRTVLAGTGTFNHPTVVAARREMASWLSIHLEPSSLRSPDRFGDPSSLDEYGRHIAATLSRLEKAEKPVGSLLQEVSNRLARLVPEVESIRIDRDDVREQLSVQAKLRGSSTWLPPRALSDGTLRFLALVTMELDPSFARLLCIEEPENGIQPAKIPAVVDLLRDFAVDTQGAVEEDNPLRQVVFNTHSPEVVRQMDAPDVLFVHSAEGPDGREAVVRPIRAAGNWRGEENCAELWALAKFIGGSPLSVALRSRPLQLDFGTAG